jgi:hypothetical protein
MKAGKPAGVVDGEMEAMDIARGLVANVGVADFYA